MKEVSKIEKDQIAAVKQLQQKKNNFLGSITLHEDHCIWEFNTKTFELRKAQYEYGAVFITSSKDGLNKTEQNKRVITKSDCYYLSSLNEKNAVKKIKKRFRDIPYVIAINE